MSFLKRLLGRDDSVDKSCSAGSERDYDYYIISKRIGGIHGRWEEMGRLNKYIDATTGQATYSEDGGDLTLKCLGVKNVGDGEQLKKPCWVHYSADDLEEEAEERKQKNEKGGKNDELDRTVKLVEVMEKIRGKGGEAELIKGIYENQLGMMDTLYQNMFNLYNQAQVQRSEVNKWSVFQEGIREGFATIRDVAGDMISKGQDESKGEEENFENYTNKILPSPKKEQAKLKSTTPMPGPALRLLSTFIEEDRDPESFLDIVSIAFPKIYDFLASANDPGEILEILKPFSVSLPGLSTEKAIVWLEDMLNILKTKSSKVKTKPSKVKTKFSKVKKKEGV